MATTTQQLTLAQFMRGLRHVENGGQYNWENNGYGAYGAYQFTNYSGWAAEAGVNPNDHSKAAQDAVARYKIKQYLRAYNGNYSMVAAAWFGGPGGAHAWASGQSDPADGTGTSTSHYVSLVMSAAGAPAGTYPDGGGGGGSALTKTPNMKVSDYLDNPQIAADYGYLAAYMKDPEIGPILAKAAKQGWGQNQLLGALSKTKWWKTTSDSARAWQAQQRTDPATARQRLNQMVGQVQQLAQSTLGLKLDPNRAQRIANTALASNWSQNQLQVAVGAEFHYSAAQTAYGGAAGQTLGKFKQMSSDWLVPMSNHTLNQWTKGVLEGTYQPADFESYLKAQAKSLYPTLKAAIDSGVTVKQYLDPYAQLAAQTLEVSPDSIDWMKPKWSKALNTTTPDGHRAPMSLSDWGTYLRGLPDYRKTAGATQSVYDLADAMVNQFGKVAS